MAENQYAFYFDQTRCMGCNSCTVACKDWNDVKPGQTNWRRLSTEEQGSFPNTKAFNLVLSCNHCANPACTAACPVGAIYKRAEDGIVVINRDLCQDIRACAIACPYGAPQFGDDESEPVKEAGWAVDHPMQKCTFCWDRWEEGLKPACVSACANRALDAGTAAEIKAKYPNAVRTVVGMPDDSKDANGNTLESGPTVPTIFFRPKS
jgi:anaerobic dimethyl sulfoxide reductase subunit B (iron-sulfur subunit)